MSDTTHSSQANETYINAPVVAIWVFGTLILLGITLVGVRSLVLQYSETEKEAKIYSLESDALKSARSGWEAEVARINGHKDQVIQDYEARRAAMAAAAMAVPPEGAVVDPNAAPPEGGAAAVVVEPGK